jgi:predicted ATPase
MKTCECREVHRVRRVVLTGGPGAGKTAVLELIRQSFCEHIIVLPEAAGIVFGGGFPRGVDPRLRRAAQRAIFHVQHELEEAGEVGNPAVVLCDRGTIDGLAYWPEGPDYLASVGTSLAEQYARYDAVIHLRTPGAAGGYNQHNPLRIETAAEAEAIDERILHAWDGHPRRFLLPASADFLEKAERAIAILREEVPACCRRHVIALNAGTGPRAMRTSVP